MHVRTKALLRRLILALIAVVILGGASASNGESQPQPLPSLAIYPFASEDPMLGMALADELAAAFHDQAIVFGPDVAAGLVPPVVVVDGYINLGRVLGGDVWPTPTGAALLHSGGGVNVAVTGAVEQYEDHTLLRLHIAFDGGSRGGSITAEPGDRARLVRQASLLVAPLLGTDVVPAAVATPALEGSYLEFVRAVGLAATGLVSEATAVNADASWPERGSELLDDLRAVDAGNLELLQAPALPAADAARRVGRRALMALTLDSLHEAGAENAFAALAELTGLPVAYAWGGILASDRGDASAAEVAFAQPNETTYAYATALQASFQYAQGNAGRALNLVDTLAQRGPEARSAALLGAYTVALVADDVGRQKTTLQALARAVPFLAYPHQALSFIAFDEDDALAAAEALAVAVELEPESSLYWTNLGWARYLLGFLDASAEASQRAIALDSNAYIAAYNLGLVHAVNGRLDAALEAYDYAVALDPAINDEVIVDLVNARQLYPGVSAVEYALARLYDAKGQRLDARTAYRRFQRSAEAEGRVQEYATYLDVAASRIESLSAPLPPLEIFGDVSVRLGQRGPEAAPFHPGDPIYPSFELSTPGDQLPGTVNVTLSVAPVASEGDAEPVVSVDAVVEVPAGAVGFVVDTIALELPTDLQAGAYELQISAESGEELSAAALITLNVEGQPVPLRQLFGRNVVMTGLEVDSPLYSRTDVDNPDRAIGRMLQELRDAAPMAEVALPVVEGGRFDGMGGAEVFQTASASDVAEFLAYVAGTDTRNTRFTFVDGFAQWAVDGTP